MTSAGREVLGELSGHRIGLVRAAGGASTEPPTGRQAHGLHGLLTGRGAEVVWVPAHPLDGPGTRPSAPRRRVSSLLGLAAERRVSALVVDSNRAAHWLFDAAETLGIGVPLAGALRTGDVVVAAPDPGTGAALAARGIDPLVPGRAGDTMLADALCDRVRDVMTRRVATPQGAVEVRGTGFVHAGCFHALPDAQATLLRVLAARPGRVVSRAELVRRLPGLGTEHALEMVVCRLRAALPVPLVATVPRRGYRLVA